MAYSDLDVDIVYVGDNSTVSFPINFARTDDSYVKVELYDVTDPANPVQLSFVNPTDWIISGDFVVAAVAPTTDQKLMIYRDGTPTHETNYTEYEFPFATMNVDLDKVYQLAQENKRSLELCIQNSRFNEISGDGDTVDIDDVITAANSTADIAQNTADIANHEGRITTNEGQISTNTSNIATNTSNIGTNTSNIGTNTSDIANHEGRITTNEGDIATLQAALGTVTPPTIVSITAAATHPAANQEVIIIDTNDAVAVNLPAPSSGVFIRVKVSEKTANKTINNASGIDGFGATYTISSEYESISLVSDGTKWYII